jgi:hypothetical protein
VRKLTRKSHVGVGTTGSGEDIRKGGQIWWKCYVLRYENGKMRPVETNLGIGGGEIREKDGGGEFN